MEKKKKRILSILVCVALAWSCLLGLAGCAGRPADKDKDGAKEPAEQTYHVTLFFENEKYIDSGDESLEKFMVYQDKLTAKPEEVYKKALEQLRTPPDKGYGTEITDKTKFNDVYLKGDTVYVDLSSDGLNGGSLEETFLISQIVDTLINSFDKVKQVQFLVDGKTAETLMGHIGTKDPFIKDLFTE